MDSLDLKIFEKFQKEKWEIKTLGEIAKEKLFSGNSKITQKSLRGGNFPAITGGDVSISNIFIDKCEVFVNEKLIKKPKYIKKGNLIIVSADYIRENVGKACVYLGKEKCLTGNNILVLEHNQNPKYLSYIWSSKFVQRQIQNKCKKGIRTFLNKGDIDNIKIPIPPLEVQNQIADFLSKFSDLKNEMEREMEKREYQYEYYKEKIFNRGIEEKNWISKSIIDIAFSFLDGNQKITKASGEKSGSLAVTGNNVAESYIFVNKNTFTNKHSEKENFAEYGDLLIIDADHKLENVGKSCVYLGERCILGNNLIAIKTNENPKFIAYTMSTKHFRKQVSEIAKSSIRAYLRKNDIKNLKIPLPPLEEQERIVSDLDKFSSIIYDINEGIPKMIELSDKQYEYYKEKILNPGL